MRPFQAPLLAAVIGLAGGGAAWGGEGRLMLAGEILIGSDKSDVRTPGARSQRERAGAYQRGGDAAVPVPEDDSGMLAPRSGAPAEERAFDNRMRAKAYQQGGDSPSALPGSLPGGTEFPGPATPQERARDLRSRARAYTGSGNAHEIDLSHVGSDGIPIVACGGSVDNVTARIGDDGTSGSVFYIMRNGQSIKVRCR